MRFSKIRFQNKGSNYYYVWRICSCHSYYFVLWWEHLKFTLLANFQYSIELDVSEFRGIPDKEGGRTWENGRGRGALRSEQSPRHLDRGNLKSMNSISTPHTPIHFFFLLTLVADVLESENSISEVWTINILGNWLNSSF